MLINTFLDTEDFVHLYYEDEPATAQGCGAGARLASKYPQRPPSPSPDYTQVPATSTDMTDGRERCRAPPQPEPPPHRVRAADLYPRLRTHYDEPGLDVGFTPICGEFVQWVGRTADGGTVAMSNYRFHAQPRRRNGPGASVPLRLIDGVEVRDLLHLVILCKHGRQLKCSFTSGEQCVEWWRRLNTALSPLGSVQETFAAAYAAWAKEQPPTSVHRALMKASHAPQRHWFGPEVERLGFTTKGAWRVTAANAEYKLCPSYPPLLVVPACIGDEDLDSVARFRAMRRIPTVVWRHRGNGAVIARSSQPEVGWLGWRSSEDERLLAAFVSACNADRGMQPANTNKQLKLLIVDARSYASAVTNRARGGGCECQQYYPAADIQFMCLPNIHHVRRSFQQMRALTAEPSDQTNWHSNLERTLWLQYVSGVLRAAGGVARAAAAGRPALVHCSDGWDRTPQIVAAAQLLLDPHYRTVESICIVFALAPLNLKNSQVRLSEIDVGFRVLIEREWLDFGHKFADRCGHQFGPEEPNERSPIFLQWLDVVHQVMVQYPCSFEFNEAYLDKRDEIAAAGERVIALYGGNPNTHNLAELRYQQFARAARLPPTRDSALFHSLRTYHQIKLATHVHSCMFGTFLCNTGRERAEGRVPDTTAHVWQLLRAPAYRNHLYSPHHSEQVVWPQCGVRYMRVWWALFSCEAPHSESPDAPAQHKPPHSNGLMTKTRSCDNLLNEGEKRTTQRRCSDPSLAPDVMKLSMVVKTERECRAALTDSCVDELPVLPVTADTGSEQQVDNLHPDHFETSPRVRDLTSGSSSLERELADTTDAPDKSDEAPDKLADKSDLLDSALRVAVSPDVDTPEEPAVFVCDAYGDVIGMAEAAREQGRTRNISITWRSISESSNQSSTGFDIADTPRHIDNTNSHESSPIDNHNSTEGDMVNHNVCDTVNGLTHHRENGVTNGINGVVEVATKFLEVDLNGGATSSSISSESEGEAAGTKESASGRARGASQLTLCPASPRRPTCCHCARRHSNTSGIETSGDSTTSADLCWCGGCGAGAGVASGRVRCVCGAGAGAGAGAGEGSDALDGLPAATDPLQARLHQIILYQKKVVEELSGQLREAREALRRSTPGANAARASPSAPSPTQMTHSSGGSRSGGRASTSASSSSGSASEVEVGEEARGVVWLPDHAAPRCQHCRNHFWLARRRHHCRRCGGIFCGSCSEVSAWGECGAVRMCRRCRALR